MALNAPLQSEGLAEVGVRLRAARAKIGMTRKRLAEISGTSERYLAQIESGAGNPSLGVLVALAQALDMAPADLLPQSGECNAAYAGAAYALRRLPEARLPALLAWIKHGGGAESAKGRRIALIGLRGAGKSSLGQALGERIQVPFFEISKEVERVYGANIGLLIELSGQNALRRYEAEAWEAICESHETAIVAVPGGIVANAPFYERLLTTAHSVWLEASPEDHMARVMAQGDFRPMASNRSAMEDLKAILRARGPEYARADIRLDTSAQDFAATLSALERTARKLADIT
ncbi:MAG TPA: shikimate kinase [Rhizomicrobium sp.]|nr:shikimate kinase [Rhizomicrobium sp.]